MKIDQNNYEQYLVDHLHGELHGDLLIKMKLYLQNNPQASEEYLLLQQTIVSSDDNIVYSRKESLLKHSHLKLNKSSSFKKIMTIASIFISLCIATYFVLHQNGENDADANTASVSSQNKINNRDSLQVDTTQIDSSIPSQNIAIAKHPSNLNRKEVTQTPNRSKAPAVHSVVVTKSDIVTEKQVLPPQNEIKEFIDASKSATNVNQQQAIATTHDAKFDTANSKKLNELRPKLNANIDINETWARNDMPKEDYSVHEASSSLVILDDNKHSRLFNVVNKILRFTHKVKSTKESWQNADIALVLGKWTVIHLN